MSYLDEHRDEIFKKYTEYELLCDIRNYIDGDGKLRRVLKQFFDEIMFECRGPRGSMSPMDALSDDSIVERILEIIESHPKVYDECNSQVDNIRTFFRIGGMIADSVYNFDPRVARELYFRYFPDYQDVLKRDSLSRLNMLDTSCGFGSRMSAVLLSGMNYYGTDPNKKLYDILHDYYRFLLGIDVIDSEQVFDIRCQGSEEFIQDWENKMDVMFTSPPYWNVEYYSDDGFASTKHYNNYKNWLRFFIVPTAMNVRKYLKTGGYLMINIRNRDKIEMFDDIRKIITNIGGFEPVEVFNIEIGSRKRFDHEYMYDNDNKDRSIEPVMSFRKII